MFRRAAVVVVLGVALVAVAARLETIPAIDLLALAGVACVLGGALLALSHRAVRFDLEQHVVEQELVIGPWRRRARYRLEQFRSIEVVGVGRMRALLERVRGDRASIRLDGPVAIDLPDSLDEPDRAANTARRIATAAGLRCDARD